MNERKKILYFTSRIPFPLEKGDKLRAFHQIKHLSKDYDVVLCSISSEPLSDSAEKVLSKYTSSIYVYQTSMLSRLSNMLIAGLNKFPFQVGYFFNSGAHLKFKEAIEIEKPDHLFVQLIRMAEYAVRIPNIPKSLDYMDTFSKGIERRMLKSKGLKKLAFKFEYNRLKKYEETVFNKFEETFIISQQDKDSFTFENANKINIVPNGVDHNFFSPDASVQKTYDIVFTGNMSYPPNVNAVSFIAKKIMPLLIEKKPDIKFLIAGATPSTAVKSLASENIQISGWLDDIRDAYNESTVFLAPLQIGTGLQNKLLEAMCMELPCITSYLANNALNATKDSEILLGETPEEYASHVLNLLSDESLRNQIAKAGKKHIENHFNWSAISNQLSDKIFK